MFERPKARRGWCSIRASFGAATGRLLPALLVLAVVSVLADGGQYPWYYAVGTERSAQQANFCLHEELVLELARTFEQQGPRAGYSALDQASDCTIRVQSFTPLRVIKRVPITTGDGGQYTVTIVEIQTASGAREYLVTTREVRE
jgi:hypothetical protein